MLAGDESRNYEHRKKTTEAFSKVPNLYQAVQEFIKRVGGSLIEKESFELKKGQYHLDIIRDVATPLNAQLLADLLYFDLRMDENPTGTLSVAQLYKSLLNMRQWATNNTDPAEFWNRRRRATEGAKVMIDSTRKLVDEVVASRGLGFAISAALAKKLTRQAYLRENSVRSCGFKLVDALFGQGNTPENVVDQLWLNAFGAIGVFTTTVTELPRDFMIALN